MLEELSKIAGTEPAKLSESIFAVGSPLLTLGPREVILADCKDYEEDGHVFSVSQIEELGFSHFYEKQKELFEALEAYWSKQASYFAALLVTDVNTQNSLLLISAPPEFLATITYPNRAANLFELNNVDLLLFVQSASLQLELGDNWGPTAILFFFGEVGGIRSGYLRRPCF